MGDIDCDGHPNTVGSLMSADAECGGAIGTSAQLQLESQVQHFLATLRTHTQLCKLVASVVR